MLDSGIINTSIKIKEVNTSFGLTLVIPAKLMTGYKIQNIDFFKSNNKQDMIQQLLRSCLFNLFIVSSITHYLDQWLLIFHGLWPISRDSTLPITFFVFHS